MKVVLPSISVASAAEPQVQSVWALSANRAALLLTIFFVVFENQAFWRALWRAMEPTGLLDTLFIASVGVLLAALTLLVLTLMALPYVFKPLAVLVLMGAAATAYFMNTYGVVVDSVMVQNMVETDMSETSALLSGKLLVYLLLLGLVPAFFLTRVQLTYQRLTKELLSKLKIIALCFCVALAMILSFSADYASFFRNHKNVRQMANPLNFIYGGMSFVARDVSPTEMTEIGRDAHLGVLALKQSKPTLLVLVVGETARADHFGLNGYERDTTPLLAQQKIINFSQFTACGTSTAISVPCMFSDLGRDDYRPKEAKWREGLLDVITHAGLPVLWRDNNSGCKGTCDRVSNESLVSMQVSELCDDEECYDNILLHDIDSKLVDGSTSQVIVLHQQGSHGPEYYRRYPKVMEHYSPVCTTNQLQDCSNEQVVNAYDNSIRYTDQALNATIEWLKQRSQDYSTAMIYVSDHGESLGESRIYLHGMPYSIAPDVQKHVPFVAWFSDSFWRENHLDKSCVEAISQNDFSQDNIFHSVLGLLNIETSARKAELDMFAACRHS